MRRYLKLLVSFWLLIHTSSAFAISCEQALTRIFPFTSMALADGQESDLLLPPNLHIEGRKVAPSEKEILRDFARRNPLFRKYWSIFEQRYHNVPAPLRRFFLSRYEDFARWAPQTFEEFSERFPGALQVLALEDRPLKFGDVYRLFQFMNWVNNHYIHSQKIKTKQRIYFDTMMFRRRLQGRGKDAFRNLPADQFRELIYRALGENPESPVFVAPTVMKEGGDTWPEEQELFGAISTPDIFTRNLSAKELDKIHRIARMFRGLRVGKKNSDPESPDFIPKDAWIMAEIAYANNSGVFVTFDHGIICPIMRELKNPSRKNIKVTRSRMLTINGVRSPVFRVTVFLGGKKQKVSLEVVNPRVQYR